MSNVNTLVQINRGRWSEGVIINIDVIKKQGLRIILNNGEAMIAAKDPVRDILRSGAVDWNIKKLVLESAERLSRGVSTSTGDTEFLPIYDYKYDMNTSVWTPIKFIVVLLIMIFILGMTNINTQSFQRTWGMLNSTDVDTFESVEEWKKSNPGFEMIAARNRSPEMGQLQLLGSMDRHGSTVGPHFDNIAIADVMLPKSKAFVQNVFETLRWPRQPTVGFGSQNLIIQIFAKWQNNETYGIQINNFYKLHGDAVPGEGEARHQDDIMEIKDQVENVLTEQLTQIKDLGMFEPHIQPFARGWAQVTLIRFMGGTTPLGLLFGVGQGEAWHRDGVPLKPSDDSDFDLRTMSGYEPITNQHSTFYSVQTFTYYNADGRRTTTGIPDAKRITDDGREVVMGDKDLHRYQGTDDTSTYIVDQRYAMHTTALSNIWSVNRKALLVNFYPDIDTEGLRLTQIW